MISAELPMYDHHDRRTRVKPRLEMLDGYFDPDSMVSYVDSPDLGTDTAKQKQKTPQPAAPPTS